MAVRRDERREPALRDDDSEESGEVSPSDDGHSASNDQQDGPTPKFAMTPPASIIETSRQDHKRKRPVPRSPAGASSSAHSPGGRSYPVGGVDGHDLYSRDTDSANMSKRLKTDGLRDGRYGQTATKSDRVFHGRLPHDLSELAPEIWQFIFTFLPPDTLVALSLVNRRFHSLLVPPTGQRTTNAVATRNGLLEVVDGDHIWACARRNYLPDIPKPLHGRSELDMWRLVRGRDCQFCGKRDRSKKDVLRVNVWDPPLKAGGVKIVWPFGVRSCGACLVDHSEEVRLTFFPVHAVSDAHSL